MENQSFGLYKTLCGCVVISMGPFLGQVPLKRTFAPFCGRVEYVVTRLAHNQGQRIQTPSLLPQFHREKATSKGVVFFVAKIIEKFLKKILT